MKRSCLTCGAAFTPRTGRTYQCPIHEAHGRAATGSPSNRAQNAEYHRERRRVLADHLLCYWCRRAPGTTADHLVPVSRGGGHVGNIVAAYPACNYSRQANPNWKPPA